MLYVLTGIGLKGKKTYRQWPAVRTDTVYLPSPVVVLLLTARI